MKPLALSLVRRILGLIPNHALTAIYIEIHREQMHRAFRKRG